MVSIGICSPVWDRVWLCSKPSLELLASGLCLPFVAGAIGPATEPVFALLFEFVLFKRRTVSNYLELNQ